MRIKVDKTNDALYFRLDESPIVESEEVQPGIVLDYKEIILGVGHNRYRKVFLHSS
jgi:hypothetical protein